MKLSNFDDHLATLVGHRTVTADIAVSNESLIYLEDFFAAHGLHVKHFNFNGKGAFVATTIKDSKTPKVLLAAHLDVVPGNDEQFTLREIDGKLYGRGSADMKFAIASYMYVVEMLEQKLQEYDFGIMITIDEENGGASFASLLELGYRPDVCVLPDGAENWEIETLAKGLWWCQITVQGKAAHGSRPWEGDSASMRLLDILNEIRHDFKDQVALSDTLNIGLLQAGVAVNQIPENAQADLDFRFVSHESYSRVQTMVEEVCAKHGATTKTIVLGMPCVNDMNHPLIVAYKESVINLVGVTPQGIVAFGGSDARFFSEVGVPCIVSEPYAGDRHGANEWIDKQGYEQYRHVLIDYLNKVAKQV